MGSTWYASTSPTKQTVFGGPSYIGQPSGLPAHPGGYEGSRTSTVVENGLSLAIRDMTVADDYAAIRNQGSSQQMPIHASNPQAMMQPHTPYGVYPQTDFPHYYPSGSAREPYIDYPYSFGGSPDSLYTPPGTSPTNLYPGMPHPLHPNVVDVQRQQIGHFYDYGAASRPATQFYYPNQAMIYPPPAHSPMMTPQLAQAHPVPLADKKRDHQVCTPLLLYLPNHLILYIV
jgi:hypothetical protein